MRGKYRVKFVEKILFTCLWFWVEKHRKCFMVLGFHPKYFISICLVLLFVYVNCVVKKPLYLSN
jgi:hypothetical protein